MSADLLPCPFCGGSVTLERAHQSHSEIYGMRQWYGVKCRNTLNLGGTCAVEAIPSASPEAAIERWNRRTPVQAQGVALSEREAFEGRMRGMGADDFTLRKWIAVSDAGESYKNPITQDHWKIWQARAALAQAQQSEDARCAKRYRHMRAKAVFQDRNGPGLYWYLPRLNRALSDEDRLDAAIDAAIAALTGSAT